MELVKCEECLFYEECKRLYYKCPQVVNFDNLMWTVLKGKILKTIKDEIHIAVKNIIKRYDDSVAQEKKSSLTARERIDRMREFIQRPVEDCAIRIDFLKFLNSPQFKREYAKREDLVEAIEKESSMRYEDDKYHRGLNDGLRLAVEYIRTHKLED